MKSCPFHKFDRGQVDGTKGTTFLSPIEIHYIIYFNNEKDLYYYILLQVFYRIYNVMRNKW
jgi:hypothetical protein